MIKALSVHDFSHKYFIVIFWMNQRFKKLKIFFIACVIEYFYIFDKELL